MTLSPSSLSSSSSSSSSPSAQISVLYDTIRWEEKALLETAKKRDIPINVIDCKKLALELDGNTTHAQKILGSVIIQRCVSYYRNLHSTAALQGLGINVINCLNTAIFAGNKLFTHMLLKNARVPTPYATVAFSEDAALETLTSQGFPKIIKPTVGSWGRLISKLNNKESAKAIIKEREKMYPIYQVHYLEEFVQRPPRDIRAIMIGDQIVAAIYRNSKQGDWKTNMALGGHAEPCPITKEMEDICIKAKNAVQGQIVGVDLMESDKKGLVIHEINNTTEYKNTVRVCKVDIQSLIIDYAQEQVKR